MTTDHDTTFEPFASHPFYREINKELVYRALSTADREQPTWATRRVVDIACGTGAISGLVVGYWEEHDKIGELIGLDPADSALQRARRAVQSRFARFVQGAAESLTSLVSAADVVLFGNAIHLLEDKGRVLAQVRDTLNARGIFAFNSSFYEGAYAEGTQRFYRQWMVRAMQIVRREHPEMRTDRNSKVAAMRWLSADEYRTLLAENGFTILHQEERTAELPLESWTAISGYTDFAEGALPGIPLKVAVPALQKAVREVFEEMQLTAVPRNWFQVIAQRA